MVSLNCASCSCFRANVAWWRCVVGCRLLILNFIRCDYCLLKIYIEAVQNISRLRIKKHWILIFKILVDIIGIAAAEQLHCVVVGKPALEKEVNKCNQGREFRKIFNFYYFTCPFLICRERTGMTEEELIRFVALSSRAKLLDANWPRRPVAERLFPSFKV